MIWVVKKRVWVDSDTQSKLSELFRKTRGYVIRNQLIAHMLYEWISAEGITHVGDISYVDKFGDAENISKRRFINFQVEYFLWNDFICCCSDNGLNANIGFKIAVNHFLYIISNNYENILSYIIEQKNMIRYRSK